MKKTLAMLLLCVFVLSGCAGQDVREKVLKPVIQESWAELRQDAVDPTLMDEALTRCQCPELVVIWAQTAIVPTGDNSVLSAKIETVKQLTNAINIYCGVDQ